MDGRTALADVPTTGTGRTTAGSGFVVIGPGCTTSVKVGTNRGGVLGGRVDISELSAPGHGGPDHSPAGHSGANARAHAHGLVHHGR